MNRSQRRKWLKKPQFKKDFSLTERKQADKIIKASNGLNSRIKTEPKSSKTLKNKLSQRTDLNTTEGLTVENLTRKLNNLIK